MAVSGDMATVVESERRVLASILVGQDDALDRVRKTMGDDPNAFEIAEHASLYRAMLTVANSGGTIEAGILAEMLAGKKLDGTTPAVFLSRISDTVQTSSNAEHYARAVIEHQNKRYLAKSLKAAARACSNGHTASEILETLHNEIQDISIQPSRRSVLAFDTISAAELNAQTFPPINWIVKDIIADGLTLLAGAPKVGKSWLALRIAGAVACGGAALGKVPVDRRGVWYWALEDNRRRLQSRQRELFDGEPMPDGLLLMNSLPDPANRQKSLAAVPEFLDTHPDIGLIIVDTLARVRPQGGRDGYQADADALGWWHELAHHHGVAVVVIHHTRKLDAEDPLDTVSGTRGLTGIADTVVTLTRGRGEADGVLNVAGRDVPDQRLALRMEPRVGWELLGEATEFERTEPRREIIAFLLDNGPATCQEIADARGTQKGSTHTTLNRMVNSGDIKKRSDGTYTA